jgi:cell division protein FtsB
VKELKRSGLRILIGAEIVIVSFLYLCSAGGLPAVQQGDKANAALLEEIKAFEAEIASLSRELDDRTHNSFYKESIARQELQMAHEHEKIYVLPKG